MGKRIEEKAALMAKVTQNYGEPASPVTGDKLSSWDLAAAMSFGGASRAEALSVLAKWVQDKSAQEELFYAIYDQVVQVATKKKWRIPKGKQLLRKLTRLAIMEHIAPCRCQRCKGRGMLYGLGRVPKVCPSCGGVGGGLYLSGREKARLVEVSGTAWRNTWLWRYNEILRMLQDIDSKGLLSLAKGLKDG